MLTSGTPNGNSTLLKKFQVPYLFWSKSWNKVFADLRLKMYWSSTVTSIEKRKELQFNGPEQWLRNFIMVSGTWRADPSVNTLPSLLVGHTFSIVRVQILKKKKWKLPLISTVGALFWVHHPPHRAKWRLNVGLQRLASSSPLLW